jgi:hypothetical protein
MDCELAVALLFTFLFPCLVQFTRSLSDVGHAEIAQLGDSNGESLFSDLLHMQTSYKSLVL